jgi:hypothetical protein
MYPVTLYRIQVPADKHSNQQMDANQTTKNYTQRIKFLQYFSARAPSSENPKYKGLQVQFKNLGITLNL